MPLDWQLPPGVDRGLWDYLHADDMVAGYDEQMRVSPLAATDVAFCERAFPTPGKLVDLGCGTGRLCVHFAAKGYDCVGVDLSDEMLAKAKENAKNLTPQPPSRRRKGEPDLAPLLLGEGLGRGSASFVKGNLVELTELPAASFDYAACLFSTLGMVRGADNRAKVVANAFRLLKPGGRFVLHVHNRYFGGLGWRRVLGQRWKTLLGNAHAGDITMSQAYGGAPLTLHHFTQREATDLLVAAGFVVREVSAIGDDGRPATGSRAYGWLVQGERRQ
ncbi:MAG: class I SAM-dependent methyltransferase [Planctomycetes bacterium]|nr:class I SAM-dependent methyltransferase [Planctomycetota bacterium]